MFGKCLLFFQQLVSVLYCIYTTALYMMCILQEDDNRAVAEIQKQGEEERKEKGNIMHQQCL